MSQFPPAGAPSPLSSDERMWGMLAHLAAFSGVVIPFGHIAGPVIVWQIKKDEFPFVDYHGKESVNFQISCVIAALLCIP